MHKCMHECINAYMYNFENNVPKRIKDYTNINCTDIFYVKISSFVIKWPEKSTTSSDMLDFKSSIKSLTRKYLMIERHMLQIQGILFQYLKFNWPLCPSQIFIYLLKCNISSLVVDLSGHLFVCLNCSPY